MLFNIKNWQDKHLIKESKLKEMDFKDKAAFDKYQSKHNMRKSTKVSIGGKDTTAGAASGKDKPSTASKMTSDQKLDTVFGAYERMKDLAKGKGKKMSYDKNVMQDELVHIKKSGMSLEDAKVELHNVFDKTNSDNYEGWPEKSIEAMHSHLEDVYADSGVANKNTHDGSKMTPQQKKSVVGDAIDDVTTFTDRNGYIDLTVDKLSPIYISGMSKEDARAELKTKMDPATNDKLKDLSKYKLKKADKELDRLLDKMYAGDFDYRINSDSIRSDRKRDMLVDPKLDKQIKKNAVSQDAENQKETDKKNARISKKNALARAEKLKNRTPKEIEKAKTQFKFSEYDYQSPKEYRDNVKDILQKTYDLDEVEPDRLQQMIDGADEYFHDEARSAGKAGRRSKPTSAKDFANYIEQYFDEDGIEPKNESVTPRSARIQEAKMYQTIQELKGLEKGL